MELRAVFMVQIIQMYPYLMPDSSLCQQAHTHIRMRRIEKVVAIFVSTCVDLFTSFGNTVFLVEFFLGICDGMFFMQFPKYLFKINVCSTQYIQRNKSRINGTGRYT